MLTRWRWLATFTAICLLTLSPSGAAAEPTPTPIDSLRERRLSGDVFLPAPGAPASAADAPLSASDAAYGNWSRLAFQTYRDGNYEIYSAAGDGSSPTRLTRNSAVDSSPRLTRGGYRIVFVSSRDGNNEIYTMYYDGSLQTRLTNSAYSDTNPVWSSDGKRILFQSNRTGTYQLFIMNSDGTALSRLTNHAGDDITPSWSPDGASIAWARRAPGSNTAALYVSGTDGSGAHYITDPILGLESPRWSPDGKKILFDYDADGDGWQELAVINPDGTGKQVLVDGGDQVDCWSGTWAPDAKGALYTRIEWVYVDDTWYYTSSTMLSIALDTTVAASSQATDVSADMMPDWVTTDVTPPSSAIDPLPSMTKPLLSLSWSATDAGGSGVRSYDIQLLSSGGPQSIWLEGTTETTGKLPLGIAYYTFWIRARDNAFNVEPWHYSPMDGDQPHRTGTYVYKISGTVRDTRGAPVPFAAFNYEPYLMGPTPQADEKGSYTAYSVSATQMLKAFHPGYAASAYYDFAAPDDIVSDIYLSPVDNMLGADDAENGWMGPWESHGDPPPALVSSGQHSQSLAYALGSAPAFSEPQQVMTASYLIVVADSGDLTHLVASIADLTVQPTRWHLLYSRKEGTGEWSAPLILHTFGTFPDSITGQPDGAGGIHLLWTGAGEVAGQGTGLNYCRKFAALSTCTSPTFLEPASGNAKTALDTAGGLHVIYERQGAVVYRYLPPGGVFSPPTVVASWGMAPDIAVRADGRVHVVFQIGDSGTNGGWVYEVNRASSEAFGAPTAIARAPGWAYARIAASSNGTVAVVWQGVDSMVSMCPPGGAWSSPTELKAGGLMGCCQVLIESDRQGLLHAFFVATVPSAGGVRHLIGDGVNPWQDAGLLSIGSPFAFDASVDPFGVAHVVWNPTPDWQVLHSQTVVAESDVESAISQRVTVRSISTHPTASLLYRTTAGSGPDLAIMVTDSVTTTRIAGASSGSGDWRHLWADLSAWKGKTITLTVSLQQPHGVGRSRVLVDEITLGSWYTPQILSVSGYASESAPTEITLLGENLRQTPTVKVGDAEVPVTWISEHAVRITVPAGLTRGLYDLWVTNPKGQLSLLRGGLRVGGAAMLPLVRRGQ